MRKIYVWWQNSKEYFFVDIFLLFAITVSIFMFSDALGIYRMTVLPKQLMKNTFENEKSCYYMEFTDFMSSNPEESRTQVSDRIEYIKRLRSFDCVEGVHTRCLFGASDGKNKYYNIMIYAPESKTMIPEPYIGSMPRKSVDDGGIFNAVVSNGCFADRDIGDVVSLSNNGTDIKIRICGRIYETMPIPDYDGGGSDNLSLNIYSSIESNDVIVFECDEIMECYNRNINPFPPFDNFMVEFKKDAGESEMKEVLYFLAKTGGVSTVDTIYENSAHFESQTFKSMLVIPIFYTVISFCAFFCITILCVIKRVRNISVYYLLGYRRSVMAAETVSRIALLILISATFNVTYVGNYYGMLAKGIIKSNMKPPYFDSMSVWIVVAISAVMLVVVTAAALCTFYGRSPNEMRRISKE